MPQQRAKALVSWSSGKDAAWALHEVQTRGTIEVLGLLTTFNETADRVAMHGVRRDLVQAQAKSIDLPLYPVGLPSPCSNAVYEQRVAGELQQLKTKLGLTHIVFGDLFLEDVRAYRERQMAELDLKPVFPLWGRPTEQLAKDMINGGLKAILSCVDTEQIPASFSGMPFDLDFLETRPDGVDACGENGEFHTLVHNGPMFDCVIPVVTGEQRIEPRFVFTDILKTEPEVPL
jgi:uncharacterized protein (TIGR00290 family)